MKYISAYIAPSRAVPINPKLELDKAWAQPATEINKSKPGAFSITAWCSGWEAAGEYCIEGALGRMT